MLSFWSRLDGRERKLVAVALALGLVLRAALALCSRGTNDIIAWEEFAKQVHEHGLAWMYANVRAWNHPPLMGYMIAGLMSLATTFGWTFPPTFKLVPIAADLAACVMVFAIWYQKTGDFAKALRALLILSLSLDAILVSSYHGNTDPLVGALILASCWAIDRERFLWGGVLLGAAVNVKLIPVLIVPLLVARASPREIAKFALGGAVGVAPFLPILFFEPAGFIRNAVAYRSNFDNWGIPIAIRVPWHFARRFNLDSMSDLMSSVADGYIRLGTYLIIAAVLLMAAYARFRRSFSVYERAALGLSAFLVFAPGFGVQYTTILGPVLVAVSLTWGLRWAVLSGLFIGSVYVTFWTGGFPLHSQMYGTFRGPSALIGMAAWGMLVAFLVTTLRPPKSGVDGRLAAVTGETSG